MDKWEDQGCVRWTENPTAVPRAMGKRIEAAGLAKTAAGSVRDGMKVVIATSWSYVARVSMQLQRYK
jgi:hypothetical protein